MAILSMMSIHASWADLTNKQLGRLIGLEVVGYRRQTPNEKRRGVHGKELWLFSCDCGSSIITPKPYVMAGSVRSCGCLKAEAQKYKIDLPCKVCGRPRDKLRTPGHYRCRHCHRKVSLGGHLRNTYKLELDDVLAMLDSQGGGCAICGTEISFMLEKADPAKANVDHCHATGKIRGILCRLCNLGLGGFRDSEQLMAKATKYLVGSRN